MSTLSPTMIRASAGSGKTFQLSSRVIQILAQGEGPEKILATTFTRKAAGEIFYRVIERLARAALSTEGAELLAEQIGDHSFTQELAGQLLMRFLREQHRSMVSTIDAFCVRVVSSFAMELGVPSRWRLVEGSERARLLDDTLERMLGSADFAWLFELLIGSDRGDSRRSVYRSLRVPILEMYDTFLVAPDKAWKPLAEPECVSDQDYCAARKALLVLALPKTQKGTENANWRKARDKLALLLDAGDWSEFLAADLTLAALDPSGTYYNIEAPAGWSAVFSTLAKHARAKGIEIYNNQQRATLNLLQTFHQVLTDIKAERGLIEFADLKRYLSSAACMNELEALYFRLDSSVRHLLLDEFQDTAPADWNVFAPIAHEILSQSSEFRSFFCVGDVKQAIYGWRGGATELFDTVAARYPQIQSVRLDTSRRSSGVIIDYVNSVFAELPANQVLSDYSEAAFKWHRGFSKHSTVKAAVPGYVRVESARAPTDYETSKDVVLTHTAKLVRDLHVRHPWATIGVLVRKNSAVGRVLYELRSGANPIAASGEGMTYLCDSPAVTLLLNVLTLGDHPDDRIARWCVARSPLAKALGFEDPFSDENACLVAKRIRDSVAMTGIAGYFDSILPQLARYVDRRDGGRVLQLIDCARSYDAEGKVRLDEFVARARHEKIGMPEPAQVRVMTIHQSKGLEFDIVVLAELEEKLVDLQKLKILTARDDTTTEFTRALINPRAAERVLSDELADVYFQSAERSLQDSLSVLYVALTRARTALYQVVAPRKKEAKNFSSVITAALGIPSEIEPEKMLFEMGSSEYGKEPTGQRSGAKGEIRAPALAFLPSKRVRRRALLGQSPSDRAHSSRNLFAEISRDSSAQKIQGIALHRLFEQIGWLEDGVPSLESQRAILGDFPFESVEKERLLEVFGSALQKSDVKKTLSRQSREGLELWRERRFAVSIDGVVISGAFDRVEIEKDAKGRVLRARIIDFKSDQVTNRESLAELTNVYKPQVESYRRVLEQMLGIGHADCSAVLLFVRQGIGVELAL